MTRCTRYPPGLSVGALSEYDHTGREKSSERKKISGDDSYMETTVSELARSSRRLTNEGSVNELFSRRRPSPTWLVYVPRSTDKSI